MGIRFLCPNGHKLNVKAYLAGERGICPQCDAKFLVPSESGGQATAISEAEISAAAKPEPAPAATSTQQSASIHQPASAPAQTPEVAAASPTETVPPPPPTSPHSPVPSPPEPAAPEEVWYVRTADGQQYGPAHTELMRQWVAEGRVTVDCHAWRTGWPEWKSGGHVITFLNMSPTETISTETPAAQPTAALPTNTQVPIPAPSANGDALPESPDATVSYRAKKRRRQERARMITLLLGVLVVVLLAVLVVVLINNQ